MIRADWMDILRGTLLAVLLVLVMTAAVLANEVDCATVRAKVAEHGKIAAIAWALANGYTPREIAQIRKRCGI